MLTLALALALAQTPTHWLQRQPNLPRGAGYAFFEAFPTSGAGTTSACSTTAPTGAKGETLTFSRTGNATCSKRGLATTGIANGDLVVMSGNVARVEPDADGVLGLRVEGSRQNVLVRSDDLGNAAYADVGTPTLTGSQTDPFATTTATAVEDNDGAAYEGRSQSVTVSAGAAYILSCYLKAGTSALARLSLDGTACNVSGLSASTWTRATCADASSSGVSIAVQLLVGNATSDTGTVIYGGCQVEAGSFASSYIPTVAAAVTRNGEIPYFANSFGTQLASGSMCASVQHMGGEADKGWLALSAGDSFRTMLYQGAAANAVNLYVSAASKASRTTTAGQRSLVGYWSSAGTGVCVDGTCTTGAGATESATITRLRLLTYSGDADASRAGFGIISRVKVDPDVTRCGP